MDGNAGVRPIGLSQVNSGTWDLGRFLRLQKIGRGFASQVYMAVDIFSNLKVALKVYHAPSLTPNTLRGVYNEIAIHGRLAHPHVLGMYAAFEDGPYMCIVSGLAEDGDLYRRLPEIRQDEGAVVKHVAGPLLSAVATMHQLNVIHRDLKPENHRPLTRLGTLHFMAPEVLLNDPRDSASRFREQVDRSSRKSYGRGVDIWAIGVIIYECLLHRAPFNGPDEKSVVQAIIANEPSYENYLSPQAVDFLRRCLTTISNQRPTAHDLYSHQWITNHMPRDKWDSLHPSNFRLITSAILSYSESGPSVREMSRRDTEVTPASEQRTRPAGSLALPSGQEVAQDRWRQRARAEHSQMAYPGVAPMRPPEDHQGSTGAASVGGASVGAASVGAAQGAYGPKPHVNVLRQAQMAWALNTLDPQRARSRDVSPGGEQALAQRMAQVTVDPPPAPQGRVLPGAPDLSVHRSALSVPNQSREAAVRQGVRPVDVAGNGPWVHHPGYPHMHAVAYGGQMGMAFPVQPQYMQGRYAHRQPIQGQFVHAQYAQGQPMQGQFVHAQYAQGQPIQGQFIHAQYAQGQPIQGQFLQTPPQAHQAFHGADTLGSAGQMQAGSGHAQGGEAAWKGPDQKGATLPPGFDQKVQVMGWGDISTAQQGQGGAGFRPRRRSRGGTVPAAVEMTWTPPADRPRRRSGHGGPGAPGGAAVMGGTRGDGARGWEAMEGPSVGVAASLEKRGSHSGALEPSLRKSGMSGALEDVQEETTRGTPATPRELEGAALSLGRTDIGAPSERLLREARCTMEEGSALAGEGPARATRPSDGGSRKGSRKGFGFFRKKSAAEEGQVDKVKKRSSLFDGVKKMLQRSKPGDGEDASMSEGK